MQTARPLTFRRPDTTITYTPTSQFFRQPVPHLPRINADYWSLMLAGQVEVPLLLSYADLRALPAVEFPATLACAGSGAREQLISTALWRGVNFNNLMDKIKFRPEAAYARFYAVDGYTTSLPLDKLADTMLVYAMNGEALPPEHGYPVRLIAPGLAGYKMPRWVQRVEFAATPSLSYWEQRGWPASGTAPVTTAILSPYQPQTLENPVTFSGIAYAGDAVITEVEVSIDHSPWMPVEYNPAVPYCWTEWSAHWQPAAPGAYHVRVRVTAAAAEKQTAQHSITLHIIE